MEQKFNIFAELITKIVKNIHRELGPGFTEKFIRANGYRT